MRRSIFTGGKLRNGTCMIHSGLLRKIVGAIILVNFCIFMIPDNLWGMVLPDSSFMPYFIQRNIMFSAFPKSALAFWLLAPVSFVVVMASWVLSVWKEESLDMENLSILDYKSLAMFVVFFISLSIVFITNPSDNFIFQKIGATIFKPSWFAFYGGTLFVVAPILASAIVLNIHKILNKGKQV